MNALPRHTLTRIIAKHGRAICDSPKRLEALLRDLCGADRREVNILVGAMEERVAADLLRAGASVPREVMLAQLIARLENDLAYTQEAARWAVDSWAVALGVLSEAEFEARAQIEQAKGRQDSTTHLEQSSSQFPPPNILIPTAQQQQRQPPSLSTQSRANAAPPNPPTKQQSPPDIVSPQSQRASQTAPFRPAPPPAAKQTVPAQIVNAPQSSRAKIFLPPLSPKASPVNQTPQTQEPPRRRRRSVLRGCFIMLLLIVVLLVGAIFVVPAIITILREEQSQPSINDPPGH